MEKRELICTSNDPALTYEVLSAVDALQINEKRGDILEIQDIIQTEVEKDEGIVIATNILTKNGKHYNTISPTIDDDVHFLYQAFKGDVSGKKVKIVTGKSNSNREFLKLKLVK